VQRELPAIPVLIPVLPIPKLLVLFRYHDFNFNTEGGLPRKGQAALLVVPARSPLGTLEDLRPILRTLRTVLAPLRSLSRFARFLTGLNTLSAALSRRPRVRFAVADQINDLHDIKLITMGRWEDPWVNDEIPDLFSLRSQPWPGNDEDNDIYAGNRMTSLIFLGPPGAEVECYLDKSCSPFSGTLAVKTGTAGLVTMRSMAYEEGQAGPVTIPGGLAEAHPHPDPLGTGFSDRVSSLRFT
jgi:hypothetical protein